MHIMAVFSIYYLIKLNYTCTSDNFKINYDNWLILTISIPK